MAPDGPGIEPRWTSSAKSAVGCSLNDGARVWFTASHGILNEIYYPEVDSACTRDAGFLISAADGFFSEEKRHALHTVEWLAPGVPAFRMVNTDPAGRYVLEKQLCTSPEYDAVLQAVRFRPGAPADVPLILTFLLGSHLGNHGGGNTAWIGTSKGMPMLFARREGLSLAVASTAPWVARTVAYAGPTDAWHDVRDHGRLTRFWDRAENGNVALAGEVDLAACGGAFTIAIGFGPDPDTAAFQARAALMEPYASVETRYAAPWSAFQDRLRPLDEPDAVPGPRLYRASTAVIKAHASMNNDGGMIASLSVPWGSSRSDGDLGGYHLVWPRDMVSSAGGLLAAGAHPDVPALIRFLAATQEPDGHWPQNMWLNGVPYWNGIQLDETAFPILLIELARRVGAIGAEAVETLWPMLRRAAAFIVTNGPVTAQDRWEEDGGFSPFTLAVSIAALLIAAGMAEGRGLPAEAAFLRDTADAWNDSIEAWTWAADTPLARRIGVRGYYVRIGSADPADRAAPVLGRVVLKNRADAEETVEAWSMVATDALALVRYGLRSPDDPRIRDTVRVIDALLRTETATGPAWHRYNGDGYGEHEDGAPFDGTGIGRAWPLLAGERAHYELAAGNRAEAERLAGVMRAQAGPGGFLPEQVWDAADLPELELRNGRATGAAMPLVWAHAEYVKLLRSLHDGRLFDAPPVVRARYAGGGAPRIGSWRFSVPLARVPAGRTLRIEVHAAANVRWTSDAWVTSHEEATRDSGYGVHTVEVPTTGLAAGTELTFTFFWVDAERWEGADFSVRVTTD